jgi:hypothetical protein
VGNEKVGDRVEGGVIALIKVGTVGNVKVEKKVEGGVIALIKVGAVGNVKTGKSRRWRNSAKKMP